MPLRCLILLLLLLAPPALAVAPQDESLETAIEEAIESYLQSFRERRVDLGTMLAVADRGSRSDVFSPADPTQFARAIDFTLEWVNLRGGDGNITFLHTTWSQPLGESEQFQFVLDVPIGYSNTDSVGDHFGIGDVRIQFAWHPWDAPDPRDAWFLAWTLQADLLIPTGSESDGLGGGDWLVAPAAVFKFQVSRTLLYLTTRWLYADSIRPANVRGFNVPGNDIGPNTRSKTRLSALNVELAAAWEFDRRKNAVHWFALTADYSANLVGNENSLMLLKARIGRSIGDTFSVDLDLWFPLFGERTYDLTFRLTFYWEF